MFRNVNLMGYQQSMPRNYIGLYIFRTRLLNERLYRGLVHRSNNKQEIKALRWGNLQIVFIEGLTCYSFPDF